MAIKVRNLHFNYDGNPVLKDINLDILEGEFTIVLGRNGSGKSTLFKILSGILKPVAGEVKIFNQISDELPLRDRSRVMGFLTQNHKAVFPFTVKDVVLTGRAGRIRLTPKNDDYRCAMEAMERIGIIHLRDRIYTELSGGEQQMVMIARVLAQDPRIILFDEPTTHLDFYYQAKVMNVIRELANMKFTVVAILHDPNIASLYADRFILLKEGKVLDIEKGGKPLSINLMEDVYGMKLSGIELHNKTMVLPCNL
jgi:iron complex transport system ATP-binding protein